MPDRAPRRRAHAVTPEMLAGAPDFTPVPRGHDRHDGWSPDRQRAFIILADQLRAQRLLIIARVKVLYDANQLKKSAEPADRAVGEAISETVWNDPDCDVMLLADIGAHMSSGPSFNERARARDAARDAMNAARARYDAAAGEDSWARFKEGGGGW